MVAEVVQIFLDTLEALFAGIGTGIITVFETVIYNEIDGLSVLAEWMLIFMGFSFALSVFYMIFRKVR